MSDSSNETGAPAEKRVRKTRAPKTPAADTAALICCTLAFFISFRLTVGIKKCEVLFYPAFFMLMLFVVLYCSLTPFPMHNYLFMDRTTGLYGIIPENFDKGAVYLDSFFSLNYS